ncbi:enoyl-CoA hydratase [Cumulibacter soli]|uniref:enoyl-CoA hydratase n=1 Tax=Cumulibacter soli TaxID=2546344 RepID=UPI0010676D4A|nr:enoyl-CoA hydratase [Cumulibacter soli]
MDDLKWITYQTTDEGKIAIISLNRPRQRNAQHRGLLVELDKALLSAEADDAVRVVVLRAEGSSFSSGHDLGSSAAVAEREPGDGFEPSLAMRGGTKNGVEKNWLQEWHYYFNNTRRWRDLRKITIASVQGPVIAGGLMLAWCCDLIVAADDAFFCDPVGSRLGMCGLEYFAHPWEFGARKAKELLLTGDGIGAEEALQLGMVNKVFARDRLDEDTLAFARRIARRNPATALMVKEQVNQSQDIQGFSSALQACFSVHQMGHAHWMVETDGEGIMPVPGKGAEEFCDDGPMLKSTPYSPFGVDPAESAQR